MPPNNTIIRKNAIPTHCSQCGAGFAAGASFCQGCGTSTAAPQATAKARTRVAWWDMALILFAMWWSYVLVVAAQHIAGYRYDDAAYLLGRQFAYVLFAAVIAYGVAGRKQKRNWHRFCQISAWVLILLPLLPFLNANRVV